MLLQDLNTADIKETLIRKLKNDFNIDMNQPFTLKELKQIKESANRNLNKLDESFSDSSKSRSYAMNQTLSDFASVAIKEKESEISRSTYLDVAPKAVFESFVAGVNLPELFSDLELRLGLSEYERQSIAESVADLIHEEYNDALDSRIDKAEIERLKNGKKIALSPNGEPISDPSEFDKTLARVREFHRKLKGEPTKDKDLSETIIAETKVLLETNVEEAEIMMSTKGFSQSLQEMIEKLGRMTNENLPPVTDHIRVVYGLDAATNFQESTHEVLQSVMDTLYSAKFFIDEAVIRMSEHKVPGVVSDMDADVSLDVTGDEDSLLDDLPVDDEFASVDLEEPLGRAKKESVESLKMKLESLSKQYRKLVESKTKKKL